LSSGDPDLTQAEKKEKEKEKEKKTFGKWESLHCKLNQWHKMVLVATNDDPRPEYSHLQNTFSCGTERNRAVPKGTGYFSRCRMAPAHLDSRDHK